MPTSTAARQRQISWISRVPLFALLLIVGYICSWNNNDGASLVVSAADASSSIKQQGVITLNSKNFDSSLSDGKAWLIEFYAPW
mmetsp:Transcript_20267/g.44075  ORF Transcript_20267/g.44075 Transcript_20267/m.44075 type:complete len:84 (+) Transcript_20267:223-474(+)